MGFQGGETVPQKTPKKHTAADPASRARAAPIRRRLGNYQTASPRHRLLPPPPPPPPSPPPPPPRVYNLVRPQPGCLKPPRCGQVNNLTYSQILSVQRGNSGAREATPARSAAECIAKVKALRRDDNKYSHSKLSYFYVYEKILSRCPHRQPQ